MDESLAPLWPGSRNTIMPAMLPGAAAAIGIVRRGSADSEDADGR